jgi:hypothetical protein
MRVLVAIGRTPELSQTEDVGSQVQAEALLAPVGCKDGRIVGLERGSARRIRVASERSRQLVAGEERETGVGRRGRCSSRCRWCTKRNDLTRGEGGRTDVCSRQGGIGRRRKEESD